MKGLPGTPEFLQAGEARIKNAAKSGRADPTPAATAAVLARFLLKQYWLGHAKKLVKGRAVRVFSLSCVPGP
jgi:hypothetical protein